MRTKDRTVADDRVCAFTRLLRGQGVLKPDSKSRISLALTDDDIAATVEAIAHAAADMAA